MGKKSRRSNRRDRSTESGSNIPLILRRLLELEKEAHESYKNHFYSKAADKYQEGLQIIQQNISPKNPKNSGSLDSHFHLFQTEASCCLNLMMVEYSCWSFYKVIQIYDYVQMSAENEKVGLPFMCKLHGYLAMLRLEGSKENKERVVSLIETRISEGMIHPKEVVKSLEAVMILRNLKEFDSAIDLGEKLEALKNRDLSTYEISRKIVGLIGDVIGDTAAFENALSHLERYRAGYYKQKGKVFRNDSVNRLLEALYKIRDGPTKALSERCDAYAIMLAQRDFLCHQVDDKERSATLCDSAIKVLEGYLEIICGFERRCFTCHQKGTATEVQLVCSGCRFACYCSLEHQRVTWKKDAIRGMRIGHEILCPLMKAYRKWKLVSKKGNEKATKLKRRFDRECLYFLSDRLGLKDKCFQEKDMQQFLSLHNTCK